MHLLNRFPVVPIFILIPSASHFQLLGVSGPTSAALPGDAVLINGVAVTDADFNNTTPVEGAGRANLAWQRSGSGPDLVSLQTPGSVSVVLTRQMTDIVVSNTTVENAIFTSFSVPANTMGSNRILELLILGHLLNNAVNSLTYTLRVKFGGLTVYQDNTPAFLANVTEDSFNYHILIGNQNATNDQTGGGLCFNSGTAVGTPTTGISGTCSNVTIAGSSIIIANQAIDTTVAQTLEVTLQMSEANALKTFTRKMSILTVV